MPGPVSGWTDFTFEKTHGRCRDKFACAGQGCHAETGKTTRSRSPRPPAKRTRERPAPPVGYVPCKHRS